MYIMVKQTVCQLRFSGKVSNIMNISLDERFILAQITKPKCNHSDPNCYLFVLDSTNQELFMMPMSLLVENIYGNNQATTMLPGNVTASAPTTPLNMSLLDCLTVHAKMR